MSEQLEILRSMRISCGVTYFIYQAEGAIKSGRVVIKQDSEEGDATPNGTKGIVMGSVPNPADNQVKGKPFIKYLYFIQWPDFPAPVGVVDWKLKEKE